MKIKCCANCLHVKRGLNLDPISRGEMLCFICTLQKLDRTVLGYPAYLIVAPDHRCGDHKDK